MTYTATITGAWIVALQIEDFESSQSTIPLSSTAVQFLVVVLAISSNCTTGMDTMIHLRCDRNQVRTFFLFVAPIYVGTRLSDVSVIVNVNSTVNDRVQFLAGCATVTIVEIAVDKPEGQ